VAEPPHLVVAAVVLDPTRSRVLLARTSTGRWALPEGHTEGGEALAEAVRRVVAEQGGPNRVRVVEPHLAVSQDVVGCPTVEQPVRHVTHQYLALADDAEEGAAAGAPAAQPVPELSWFPVSQLPDPLQPGVGLHLRAALREGDAAGGTGAPTGP